MTMIKLLEDAIASVRQLPEADQEFAARFLLAFANRDADPRSPTDEQVRVIVDRKLRSKVTANEILKDAGLGKAF